MRAKIGIVISFLCGALFFSTLSHASEIKEIIATKANFKIVVDGKEVSLKNQIVTIDGWTYIPLRELTEVLGGYEIDFKDGTVMLSGTNKTNSSGLENKGSDLKMTEELETYPDGSPKYNFRKLPITLSSHGVDITFHSFELTDKRVIFNVSVKNNNDSSISVRLDRGGLMDYKLPTHKFLGTGLVEGIETSIGAKEEVNGTVSYAANNPETMLVHTRIGGESSGASLSFPIQIK